ncbi:MAG: hypothetical protein IJH04_01565, partial [Eggerthellaceae bacterium]|nr:hypothetical protein [Eggerthellaceae bacterium]
MTDPQYLEESKAVSCHLIGIRDLGGGLSDSLRKAVERQLAEGRRVVVAFEGGMRPAHDEAIAELRKYDSVELCAVPGDVDDTDIPGEVHRIFPGLHISSVSKIGELSTRVHRLVYHLIPADDYSIRRSGDAVEFSFTKGGLSPLCSARVGDREYPLAVQGDRYSFVIPPCDFAALSTGNVISFCDAHGEDFKVICGNKLRKRLKVAHTRLVPLPGDMV